MPFITPPFAKLNHMNTHIHVEKIEVREKEILRSKVPGHERIKKNYEQDLHLVIALDLLILNLCFAGYMTLQIPLSELLEDHLNNLLLFFFLVNTLWLSMAPFTGIYQVFEGIKLHLKVKDLFWGSLIYFGIISLIYYQFLFSSFEIHFLIPTFFTFIVLSSLIHYTIRYYSRSRTGPLSYAVVGGDHHHLSYLEEVFESAYGKYAFCVGRFAHKDLPGVINLGGYHEVEQYLRANGNIDKLLYFFSDLSKNEVQQIIQLCRSRFIDFEVVPVEMDFFEKGVQVEQLSQLPIFRRKKEPLCELKNKILKRSFDVFFSLVVTLFVFPWLLPVIALLIKLESRGPVFFVQKRTGYWNKPFNCIKFRTMRVNERSDEQQATKGDSRITKFGTFLRKTNLDELPQFLNVLMGDMSIVGPRPHMLQHTAEYSKLIDRFMIRHEVKPGITGWAQVSGWRGPTEEVYKMAKRVEHDVYYIENWSFWFDCKCIFLTVFNMVKGEENAF